MLCAISAKNENIANVDAMATNEPTSTKAEVALSTSPNVAAMPMTYTSKLVAEPGGEIVFALAPRLINNNAIIENILYLAIFIACIC